MAVVVQVVRDSWKDIFINDGDLPEAFTNGVLPGYMKRMRWFGAKSSHIKHYRIDYLLPYENAGEESVYILFVEVIFVASNTETYFLPITISQKPEEERSIICELRNEAGQSLGFLIDAIYCASFRMSLFTNIVEKSKIDLAIGQLRFGRGRVLSGDIDPSKVSSRVLTVEQSNSTVVYDDTYFLKIYRKIFRNNNPDLELTRFLSEKSSFPHSPGYAGSIEWVRADYYTVSLGLMQEKVENQGEAWNDTLSEIEGFFHRLESSGMVAEDLPKVGLYKNIMLSEVPPVYLELVGQKLFDKVVKLAERTAEMHVALFSDKTDRHFIPESFTSDYTVWLLNRVMYMFDQRFHLLEQNIGKLRGKALEYAEYFIEHKDVIKDKLLNFDEQNLNSTRIRIHGDYHLGQILITGDDYCILDFEGEPESTIRDRKVKQPPIKDMAGLFRSYHYAVFATVFQRMKDTDKTEFYTDAGGRLYRVIVGVSLHYYMKTAMDGGLNIGYTKEIDFLLRYHLFEKAIYELGYELHARPDWVIIPLKGIMQILKNE